MSCVLKSKCLPDQSDKGDQQKKRGKLAKNLNRTLQLHVHRFYDCCSAIFAASLLQVSCSFSLGCLWRNIVLLIQLGVGVDRARGGGEIHFVSNCPTRCFSKTSYVTIYYLFNSFFIMNLISEIFKKKDIL